MTADDWILLSDGSRLWWVVATLGVFVGMCLWAALKGRTRTEDDAPQFLILSASQTGQALEMATQAQSQLRAGGKRVRRRSLREATEEDLLCAPIILCVASTTGEGDAPDEALVFEQRMMARKIDLAHQTFAVLALGDRKYEKFCAFGHRLHDWMGQHGARALKPCLEVDDLDPEALSQWQGWLRNWGGALDGAPQVQFEPWTLSAREKLNPESEAAGLYRIELTGAGSWQAGDLAEIVTADGHRRDYSIASVPSEGRVLLFVREAIRPDGSHGLGSGLLVHGTSVGGTVPLRLKVHEGFHAPAGGGPVLLIGAGSGLAGLRAHIAGLSAQRPLWLIYGERHPVRDGRLSDEMRQWQQQGRLSRLDLAFSRPDGGGPGQYVQDVIRAAAGDLRDFLKDGGVMVCGGRDMGRGVDEALREVMGNAWADAALASGTYRRDLY